MSLETAQIPASTFTVLKFGPESRASLEARGGPSRAATPTLAAKHTPVPFAKALHRLISETTLIGFEDGSLIIPSPKDLEKRLSSYFRHGRYASFQRQLNNFGFHRVSGSGSAATVYRRDRGSSESSTLESVLLLRHVLRRSNRPSAKDVDVDEDDAAVGDGGGGDDDDDDDGATPSSLAERRAPLHASRESPFPKQPHVSRVKRARRTNEFENEFENDDAHKLHSESSLPAAPHDNAVFALLSLKSCRTDVP